MAEELKNTTDETITDPNNAEAQIANPDYIAPAAETAAPAKLDLEATPAEVVAVVVPVTGNEVLDGVGKLLAEKKVPNADVIVKEFAENGDVSLSHKAAIVDALGEAVGGMAINQLTAEASKIATANSEAKGKVLDYANTLFGGDDANTTWEQIQEYVKTPESGFSVEDRAVMTSMLAKGGLQAKLVIDNINSVYTSDSNTTIPADLLAGDTLATGASFSPISALDYAGEVATLVAKHGYDSSQVKSLQARRERSRQQGIA